MHFWNSYAHSRVTHICLPYFCLESIANHIILYICLHIKFYIFSKALNLSLIEFLIEFRFKLHCFHIYIYVCKYLKRISRILNAGLAYFHLIFNCLTTFDCFFFLSFFIFFLFIIWLVFQPFYMLISVSSSRYFGYLLFRHFAFSLSCFFFFCLHHFFIL